jgi:hypothetical protein
LIVWLCPALVGAEALALIAIARRSGSPARLLFGRASAPMMPHRVQTMRGPNDGTGM